FNDMHAERDLLVKKVFPALTEWCEDRKLRLMDIDLRWGVTEEEATRNRNVVEVCLDRIDECRPFFLCFLGQRYGWVPTKDDVSREAIEGFPGLEKAINDQRSVTEMEILHAVTAPFHLGESEEAASHQPAEHTFFYLRNDDYLDDLPEEPAYLRRIYSDETEKSWRKRRFLTRKQRKLRNSIIPATGRPVISYRAQWSNELRSPELAIPFRCPALLEENASRWRQQWFEAAGARVTGTDVAEDPDTERIARDFDQKLTRGRLTRFEVGGEPMEDVILRQLKEAISRRFPHHSPVHEEDGLRRELDEQEQFLFATSSGFIPREGDFAALNAYARSDSDKIFVLTGAGGMGKSTLLAKWVDEYRAHIPPSSAESVHFRFIGQSDRSSSVPDLLHSLLRELQEVAGKIPKTTREIQLDRTGKEVEVDVPLVIPEDPKEVRSLWEEWAGGRLPKGPNSRSRTVVVLDALDQLPDGLSGLSWLPRTLHPELRLVVSYRRSEQSPQSVPEHLQDHEKVWIEEVRPFTQESDRRSLVKLYLQQYLKELDERHLDDLIRSEGAENPLFLKVVLAELRVFGAFATLGEKIREDFGDTPVTAFHSVLARLETDPAYSAVHPQRAVPLIFGLLAHSRYGLAVPELADIVIRVLGLEDNHTSRETASEAIHLFLRQMRPYLARRGGRYDFFFPSLRAAVRERYVARDPADLPPKLLEETWHRLLADFFHELPTWQPGPAAPGALVTASLDGPSYRKVTELPYQLTGARDHGRLETVLSDIEFIDAKCRAGMGADLAKDYQRAGIMSRNSGPPTHADHGLSPTVKEYAEFITSQLYFLTRFPSSALQQAVNLPDASSPSRAARDHIASKRGDLVWIESLNKPQALVRRMTIPFGAGECSFSSDGRRILSRDGSEVREWDAETGEELARTYDSSGPLSAGFAPPVPFDPESGKPENPIRAHSPDNGLFVRDYSLIHAETGEEVGRISPLHLSEDLRSCAISPDSRLLVCATRVSVRSCQGGGGGRVEAGPGGAVLRGGW
ncbi:MAG: NACHT domain-containing protein, partial [Gemmatimonadota bacterium]